MKLNAWRTCIGAAALVAAGIQPIWAATVTFQGAPTGLDSIFEAGQSFTSEGLMFTPTSGAKPVVAGALVGAINDPGSPVIGLEPTNLTGRYFAGYNDGAVRVATSDNSPLLLSSLDFAFMAFAPGFYNAGDVPGRLLADYVTAAGDTGSLSFPFGAASANGSFGFQTLSGASLAALGGPLRSVTFSACVFEGPLCAKPSTFGDAWFALDNIVAAGPAAVPTPSSMSLALLALLGVGALRRRAQTVL